MTDEQTVLSRRAVACPKWRLVPGMLTHEGRRVMQVWPDDLGIHWSHLLDNRVVRDADALPDLTDAATVGCLLALVRAAWGDPFLCPAADRETGWWLDGYAAVDYLQSYRSEAEALVAALEGALSQGSPTD